MPSKLTAMRICDLGKVVTGSTPPTKDLLLWGEKYPFVKPSDLDNGRRRVFSTEKMLSEAGASTAKGRILPIGTTCVVCIGTIGKVCQLDKPAATNQQINSIIADKTKVDSDYLYYLLVNNIQSVKVVEGGSASGREHVKKSTFEQIKLDVLSFPEQKKVGLLLSTYDNLIENNNRRIAVLEEMAQSLYREWFVKFRFPGHEQAKFIDSPLGKIPEGWEVMSVSDAIDINPRTPLPREGEKPFVSMRGLSELSMVISDVQMKSGNSGAKFINRDTLFARITPCLQNGKTGYVQFLTQDNQIGFGSTEFIVLRENVVPAEYIYCLARSESFREKAIKSMTGATGRQRVSSSCFDSYMMAVTTNDPIYKFSAIAKPMFDQIMNLSKRNINLVKQRDSLLPKLISGNIDIG
jgi:type I restriction enzyme, S subunit